MTAFPRYLILGAGRRKRLNVDRVVGRICDPQSVGRKDSADGGARFDRIDGRARSFLQRERPQRHARALGHGVEEPIPGGRPGFGHVRRAFVCFRQALRLAAIDRLPEDPAVAFAIRLKGDPLAISSPNGKAVVPPERQAPNGRAAARRVHMDVRFFTVIGAEREALPVGRHPTC